MANELANAASPYLRQHADNPVDWMEWGEEAFERARAEDKPIFLSVGYSSCHWCHVMAHESFDDEDIAALLNEGFVSVKVDREERPDVDAVYMDAVTALTGRGGWPMSVFLTPEGEPFFGGTYWPRDDHGGMPGFRRVLTAVREAWQTQRDEVHASGQRLTDHLRSGQQVAGAADTVDAGVADRAAEACAQGWDETHGGFGGAPKFPQAMTLDFLLAHHQRTDEELSWRVAAHTLDAMADGGIHDQVGGGFHRYAVDAAWVVPHFEKMLYDNALLLRVYTHALLVARERAAADADVDDTQRAARYARVARSTADYLLRELQQPQGGFSSATDADSEGIEGKFFVWSADEFDEVVRSLDEEPAFWREFFGVDDAGNFADPHHPEFGRHTVLTQPGVRDETDATLTERVDRVRAALMARRDARVPPALDDKVLTSWNGLALAALAEAGAALDEPRYRNAAASCAGFLHSELLVDDVLHHAWREGHGPRVPGFAEDDAFLAAGLISLYEADHDASWLAWARSLAREADADFRDDDGTYFSTAADAETLITRPKERFDNAQPSAASVMADVHLRLAALTGDADHRARAEQTIAAHQQVAERAPTGFGELLRGLERHAAGSVEVAIVGDAETDAAPLVATYRAGWRPSAVLAVGDDGDAETVPLLAHRERIDGRATAYVCRDFVCSRPVTDPEELAAQLADAPS